MVRYRYLASSRTLNSRETALRQPRQTLPINDGPEKGKCLTMKPSKKGRRSNDTRGSWIISEASSSPPSSTASGNSVASDLTRCVLAARPKARARNPKFVHQATIPILTEMTITGLLRGLRSEVSLKIPEERPFAILENHPLSKHEKCISASGTCIPTPAG